MDSIHQLIELFRDFPGIGPRQAKRFVFFLLGQNNNYRESLSRLILDIKRNIRVCASCFRFFPIGAREMETCPICSDTQRDTSSLLVVSRDVDFENIEKSHTYTGKYFVLGGSVPILERNPEDRIRIKELSALVSHRIEKEGLKEIILALNLTPEGENTAEYVANQLRSIAEPAGVKVSALGRGLSTGLELEYSDSETIKNALKNRF